MVINGGSRAGTSSYTSYLGAHLQRTDSNERVLVREMDGVASADLTDAFQEMAAVGLGSRSSKPLYHANIDWRHDEVLTEAQKERAVDRLAEELGLTGQPRVVVEHVKEGREHLHVVWCRIDAETMRAIPDSHNFRRHEIVARELEREFGHERVQGAHHEREDMERPDRCPTFGETMQAERSGMTPAEASAQLRDLWQSADSGHAFAAALDDAGWTLAQGDRRGFVALDPAGEAHAVNKAITGLSAADVRDRLADHGPLPGVDEARAQLRDRQHDAGLAHGPEDFGHGHDDGIDLAIEREAAAERRYHEAEALEAAEYAWDHRDELRAEYQAGQAARAAEQHEAVALDLEALAATVDARQARQEFRPYSPEFIAAMDARLAREAQERGDNSAADAHQAMEDLARTDPLGTERHFGHHAGDHLKSPEDMRREYADMMRGGASAEQAAENSAAWDAALAAEPEQARASTSPDPARENGPDRTAQDPPAAPQRDHLADRAAWAESLRDLSRPDPVAERQAWAEQLRANATEPTHARQQTLQPDLGDTRVAGQGGEATQRPSYEAGSQDRGRERTLKPESQPAAPEIERQGIFERIGAFVRNLWKTPEPDQQHDRAADRQPDRADDRQAEPVRATKPEPAQESRQQPAPEPAREAAAEQKKDRPAERMHRTIADDWLDRANDEIKADRAAETPEQRLAREDRERDRNRGDGSRERTRHHHRDFGRRLEPFRSHHDTRWYSGGLGGLASMSVPERAPVPAARICSAALSPPPIAAEGNRQGTETPPPVVLSDEILMSLQDQIRMLRRQLGAGYPVRERLRRLEAMHFNATGATGG